ncbi:HepA Superfamily II DNA/RNA helicases, SNF2 family [uncultured Caudovirales phage]|uniref:HepA Superfamily II DNA/RNA helicases, SNF2 family n=1 Tax=uncultured Caudovirales phage TaxID=2100421 RepID=A0A6J5P9Z5_9CAUD|nr:HepA Superfamily II DNA/RNA helicases, SNF2 family [uncultured Caudovirales phage]CAB4168719.1 HepA Superfamily II DNA/RNA helicases, SNF2 family [uncultured Caudovirales phage]
MNYKPHQYQQHATEHIINNPAAGLFLEMGLGKTVSTLTAIVQLFEYCDISKVLVIAPKKVAENTWSTEIDKWSHLSHLRISKVLGTEKQRKQALQAKADIYVTNRENVVWLTAFYGLAFPFDMLIIDELSSFKDAKSQRFKALRQIRPKISRVVGLTGTPAPNSLLELWPQLYLLDQGQRLGKTLTEYRTKYFNKQEYLPFDSWKLKEETDPLVGQGYYERKIYELIADICISMKAEDYLEMPSLTYNVIKIPLPPKTQEQYDAFERTEVLKLIQAAEQDDEKKISAVNAAALTTKLLQFANGAVYDEQRVAHEIHKEKLEALEEIIDTANRKPVLIFYSYKHDLERMHLHLKAYKPRELKTEQDIHDWNAGRIRVLFAHPASAGHGLNLQAGGNIIVWFGLTWSLELYQQANARLYRQGQQNGVIIHLLTATETMDTDVMTALAGKAKTQDALMNAVKAKIKKYLSL